MKIPQFITKHRTLLAYLAVSAVLVLVNYGNTFQHRYGLDDTFVLRQIPQQMDGLQDAFKVFNEIYDEADYRPLAAFTVALEQLSTGKLGPELSHRVNVLIFYLCALLFFISLRQLPVPRSDLLAFCAALLFIVHPIHANVVASIKNRDILLSFIFGMAALNVVLWSLRFQPANRFADIGGKLLLFGVALVLFLVGVMAKQDIISFAFIIPLAYFIWMRPERHKWQLVLRYALLIGLPYLIYRIFYRFRFEFIGKDVLDIQPVEDAVFVTENPLILDPSVTGKIGVALTSVFYYLKFHLVPVGYYYYFGYDLVPTGQLFHPYNIVAAGVLFASVIAFFYFLKRNRVISYGIGFFFLAQVYAWNLVMPVAGIVAPRLAFIASAGFCILLAALVLAAADRIAARKSGKWKPGRIAAALTLALVIFYTPFTITRSAAWKNIFTLIEADIPHLDRSFEAQRIASGSYYNKVAQAPNESIRNSMIRKSYEHAKLGSAVYDGDQYVEETIGLTAFYMGNYQEAYEQMNSVIERFDSSEAAFQVLGDLYFNNGRYVQAAQNYSALGNMLPNEPHPFVNYTESMVNAGRLEEALRVNRARLQRSPDKFYHYESVGYIYLNMGDTVRATHYFMYSMDRNSPNRDFLEVLQDHYYRHGMAEEWQRLMSGYRPPLTE